MARRSARGFSRNSYREGGREEVEKVVEVENVVVVKEEYIKEYKNTQTNSNKHTGSWRLADYGIVTSLSE